jgi:hypothetical protein
MSAGPQAIFCRRRHQPRGHLLNYGERNCSRLRNWPRYWIRARICRSRGYFLSASSSSKEAARASLKSALTLCWVDSILEGYPDRVVEQNTVIVEVPRQERDTIIEEAKGRNGQVASVTTRGRPLLGDKRLTPAERMRRYRQRKAQARQKPLERPTAYRKPIWVTASPSTSGIVLGTTAKGRLQNL